MSENSPSAHNLASVWMTGDVRGSTGRAGGGAVGVWIDRLGIKRTWKKYGELVWTGVEGKQCGIDVEE